jgi:hypothetical protein
MPSRLQARIAFFVKLVGTAFAPRSAIEGAATKISNFTRISATDAEALGAKI